MANTRFSADFFFIDLRTKMEIVGSVEKFNAQFI